MTHEVSKNDSKGPLALGNKIVLTWRDIQRAMEEARNPVYRDVASPKGALEVEGDFEAQPLGARGPRAWAPLTTEQSRGVELVDLKEDDSPSVDVDLLT